METKEKPELVEIEVIDRETITVDKSQMNLCRLEFYNHYIKFTLIYQGESSEVELPLPSTRYLDNIWYLFKSECVAPHLFYNNVNHKYNVMIAEEFGAPAVVVGSRKEAIELLNKIVEWKTNDSGRG